MANEPIKEARETSAPHTRPSGQLDKLAGLYRQMILIRRVEEECARAYAEGKIGGFLHLYIGQEAVGVGALAALRPDDYVVTTYRDHGIALAKGMSPKTLLAELWGKKTGCSQGLGGSMHLFDAKNQMLGGYGIVGGHIPLAAGVAFASKYRADGRVTLCFFGEGAVSIGGFHEGLSLAALWKLPIVFICENNEYAMGTPLSRSMSVEDVSMKALGYGVDRDRFFADDVLEVERRIGEAVQRAREQSLPSLVEVRTYRFRGHSMSDPAKYRTKDELEEHKKRDPLLRARSKLVEGGYGEPRLKELEDSVEAEVAQAVKFADESPEPDASILEETTYKGPFAS
jgi:pyruvate dehydrogenase E1 component alpha subunit